MKIDSEHLEILAVIVEKGGLTGGAAALGKSQPSVSRSMALLESRVGLPLFEPGRRPLRPTELGQNLARLGGRIRAANQEAGQLIRRYQQGQAGRLRVGGSPFFMDGVVSTIVADFQNRSGGLEIEQSYGYAEALTASLRNGSLDLAILPLHPTQVPEGMDFVPLLAGRNVIACRAGHPLTRRKGITFSDIDSQTWIAPPSDSPLFRDLQRAVKSIGREEFRIGFSAGTLASILSVLAGSDSLTVLPYSVVFLARQRMQIDVLPLRIEHPDRQLGLMTAADRAMQPGLRQFVSFLVSEFHRLQNRIDHDLQVVRQRG
ncbi:LysR family transcriptional regulator [Paracoccus sp. S-4012]|uniref:LysR family transcriptional regulator n=1 Tax=Paracoccus sp. S-4012 TaxID=2665648 RepID=UPI0012B0837A|nr:LysR family transcriptional regulator [Paracoccus sp. S-4012]MRX50383.1 LysR family transcriptional regulator [Paracoccus sp. S-4012]